MLVAIKHKVKIRSVRSWPGAVATFRCPRLLSLSLKIRKIFLDLFSVIQVFESTLKNKNLDYIRQ